MWNESVSLSILTSRQPHTVTSGWTIHSQFTPHHVLSRCEWKSELLKTVLVLWKASWVSARTPNKQAVNQPCEISDRTVHHLISELSRPAQSRALVRGPREVHALHVSLSHRQRLAPPASRCLCSFQVQCCFTSTETIRTINLLGTGGAQGGHLDFHTPPELWLLFVLNFHRNHKAY